MLHKLPPRSQNGLLQERQSGSSAWKISAARYQARRTARSAYNKGDHKGNFICLVICVYLYICVYYFGVPLRLHNIMHSSYDYCFFSSSCHVFRFLLIFIIIFPILYVLLTSFVFFVFLLAVCLKAISKYGILKQRMCLKDNKFGFKENDVKRNV